MGGVGSGQKGHTTAEKQKAKRDIDKIKAYLSHQGIKKKQSDKTSSQSVSTQKVKAKSAKNTKSKNTVVKSGKGESATFQIMARDGSSLSSMFFSSESEARKHMKKKGM